MLGECNFFFSSRRRHTRCSRDWSSDVCSSDLFCAMGIRLLRGRTFTWADSEGSLPVAIISESAVRQYWPNEDAMGKRLKLEDGSAPVWRQVIGIVGDVRQDSVVEAARPEVYAPLLQVPVPYLALAVRTRVVPTALTVAVRDAGMAGDIAQSFSGG